MVQAISNYSLAELRHHIKRADPTLLENFIRFLENDPIDYRTGYDKEIVWRYIRRYPLNDEQIHRLEESAFRCLARPMTREFKFMYQTMSHIAREAFWKRVKALLQADNPIVQINAYCLYAYSKGIYAGEKLRLEMKEVNFQLFVSYHTYYSAYSVEALLTLIKSPENWPDGVVCYRQPYAADIPTFNYGHNDDALFTSLDVAMSYKDVMLNNLSMVLSAGILHPEVVNPWNYAIYLLEQLNTPEAVQILIDFMNQKLDFAINSYWRKEVSKMVWRVLKYYGTPAALESINQLESITKNHCYAKI
jgi:hypothetical protein